MNQNKFYRPHITERVRKLSKYSKISPHGLIVGGESALVYQRLRAFSTDVEIFVSTNDHFEKILKGLNSQKKEVQLLSGMDKALSAKIDGMDITVYLQFRNGVSFPMDSMCDYVSVEVPVEDNSFWADNHVTIRFMGLKELQRYYATVIPDRHDRDLNIRMIANEMVGRKPNENFRSMY